MEYEMIHNSDAVKISMELPDSTHVWRDKPFDLIWQMFIKKVSLNSIDDTSGTTRNDLLSNIPATRKWIPWKMQMIFSGILVLRALGLKNKYGPNSSAFSIFMYHKNPNQL